MVHQKSDCENIVLSAKDKELLKEIKNHPHRECDWNEVHSLRFFELVSPDIDGIDGFGCPIETSKYHVSDFYFVYEEYLKDKRRDMMLSSLWLPIIVSIITTLVINALQWLWPLLAQWCASSPQ